MSAALRDERARPNTVAAPATGAPLAATSLLRVVHGWAGVPTLDVLVDGQVVVEALPFGRDSGYLVLDVAARALTARPTDPAAGEAPLALALAPRAGDTATVLAGPTGLLLLADESLAPVGGPARVRLVQLSPDTPPCNLVVAGAVVAAGVAAGTASDYVDVAPGTLDLAVRAASDDTLVGRIPDATLAYDRAYTFVVLGRAGGQPARTLLPLVDAPPMR